MWVGCASHPHSGEVQLRLDSDRVRYRSCDTAPSTFNLRVSPLHFGPGVVDLELPIDAASLGVGRVGPAADFGLPLREFADAAVAEALAGQAVPFAFRDGVHSTAVSQLPCFGVWQNGIRVTYARAGSGGNAV